jgi:hypothetical protein
MKRQPTRFTASVPQGNPLPTVFIAMEIRYLAAPPMKLPQPMKRVFLIISETISCREFYDNTFSPTIEAISVNVNSILQKVTGSWKKKIPTSTVPTAPIPVHTG